MKLFLVLMGIFWVVLGTLSVFATDLVRKKFFSKIKNMDFKKWSFLPIVIGILFLMSAPVSRIPLFITVLGILALIKGFYFLLVPQKKIKKVMDWWFEAKNNLYKIWGVTALILGVFVLINL